ncbi:hypothetical protein AURDEDRAFT_175336 [Auricularia subglabra TFB-10046 SS5]|nr:hypothetical protein AURDEDRAFT_175336 [Auricularia subglabra TFB-10046 SS5]
MLSSLLVLSSFGLLSLAQGAADPLAASACYLTCAAYDPAKVAPVCNVAATDSQATDDCFCTNEGLRSQFSACLDKNCADQKAATQAISDVLCKADKKATSDSIDCIGACGETLAAQLNSTCPDAEKQTECACTNPTIRDALGSCISKTCPALSEVATTYAGVLCSLDGFNISIPIDIGTNQTGGSNSSNGDNGNNSPQGPDDGDNAATVLARGGYASVVVLFAAVAAVAL